MGLHRGPQLGPPTGPGALRNTLATVAAAGRASCPRPAMEAAASGAGGLASAHLRMRPHHNSGALGPEPQQWHRLSRPPAMLQDRNIGGRRESLPSGRRRAPHHSSGAWVSSSPRRSIRRERQHIAEGFGYTERRRAGSSTAVEPPAACMIVCHSSGDAWQARSARNV